MTEQPSHPRDGNPHNPQVLHESRDVPVRGILYFLTALVVGIVIAMVVVVWLFDALLRQSAATDPPAPPLAEMRAAPLEPRLQVSPPLDLDEMRARERALLDSYAWISREDDLIRIPISEAMQMVARDGLPDWPPAGQYREGTDDNESEQTQ